MTRPLIRAIADQWPRRDVAKVEITLPLPPSANALFYNRTKKELGIAKAIGKPLPGRGKTERYRSWLRAAGNEINAQRPGRVRGAYDLTIVIPQGARLDADNGTKACSDVLQQYGIIENDRLAASVFITRSEHVARHECLVTVSPARSASAKVAA